MIVVDASAALAAFLNDGPARRALAAEQLHAPHLIDSAVASALRRRISNAQLAPDLGWKALDTWRRLGMTRYPVFSVLDRVWQSDLSSDLSSVAESLRRQATVLRMRCRVTVQMRVSVLALVDKRRGSDGCLQRTSTPT